MKKSCGAACMCAAGMIIVLLSALCGCGASDRAGTGGGQPAQSSSAPVATSGPPAGSWVSVDFVREVDQFQPGRKSWADDLFLRDFQCYADGSSSLGWTCQDGWVTHSNGATKAQYFVKEINGETYLFLPWLSGDVTERGMKPSFYAMRKTG